MRNLLFIIAVVVTGSLSAQNTIDKTFPITNGHALKMRFDYPNVKVTTWDKNEISIQGIVMINGGESNDALTITSGKEGNTVVIKSELKNLDGIPRRVTVERDGQKIVFKNKAEWEKYADEHGKGATRMHEGVDVDITLEIKVPRNTETTIESVYGMVEVKNFKGPLRVESTYGGVDASVAESSTGELVAETNYGHIYSNLNQLLNSKDIKDENFHTYVSGKPGNGPKVSFESKYGNVYLRKEN